MRVLMFAGAAEAAGDVDFVDVEVADGCDAAAVLAAIARQYPDVAAICQRSRLAVDGRYVGPGEAVPAGAEVALIPPVSGG